MDFQKEYDRLKAKGFPVGETLDFCTALGDSGEIGLHFEMYYAEYKNGRPKAHVEDSFRRHGFDGVKYLIVQLQSEHEDEERAACAAYLLAELLIRFRYPEHETIKSRLVDWLADKTSSGNEQVRRMCLIALGWIGGEREVPLLCNCMLTDSDSLCRAWSASAMLQMNGRVPAEALQRLAIEPLIRALETETDVFACGVAIETISDIWDKRLGLSGAAVERRDAEAVEKARGRALRFLNKVKS